MQLHWKTALLWIWWLEILFLPLQLPLLDTKSGILNSFWQWTFAWFNCADCYPIYSDSKGFIVIIGWVIAFGLASYFLLKNKINSWENTLVKGVDWVLCIVFLKYGLDKLQMVQFPSPEVNLLYTPLGKLDKDILFWTSMGTSPMINYLAGGVEIIGACFLLFSRTLPLGRILLLLSTFAIVAINFGFNIQVKSFSILLLLGLLLVSHRSLVFLLHYFLSFKEKNPYTSPWTKHLGYSLPFIFLIGFCSLVIQENNENKPLENELTGSYTTLSDPRLSGINRLFINRNGYWIEQLHNGETTVYRMIQESQSTYCLIAPNKVKRRINIGLSAQGLLVKDETHSTVHHWIRNEAMTID